ncbi:MAG: AMMECR1 domain-containing protein [Nitrospirae bacterium GWC2_57_13]|jgi:MEMO1 family protein|nr:MAG: AMMECR1 domain-containing protein [Nitrospirae bacterium GWC1_57_7]OGW26543.1 MAG: AMMECR1 domain-containing protein [Nitrospirae bacterium GWC2_57_13]HAR45515.1 AMMECR1 domain-containing protein [Nitrospiraceae bacterium]HAS54576.1 AMMECR1 domain-containing protein [Nitrospiraceae bacterium]
MHPLVKLAKDAVELYVRTGKRLDLRNDALEPELRRQAGVFVCLKIKGSLRGCIGTFQPTEPSVAHETIRNAVSAATCDPRFACLRDGELDSVEYTVDVLTQPEPVHNQNELDPRRYGVIVQSGAMRGLLLPDLEGVDTAEKQISIARQKAGMPPDGPVDIYRFEVQRLT